MSGGAANASAAASLGGAKSSNVYPAAFFDDNTAAESAAGDVEYRCFYVHNNNATITLNAAVIWQNAATLGAGHAIAYGIGSSAVNGIEQSIANEDTAPVGVTFSTPVTQGTGLALGSLPAGQGKAVWQRRTVTAGSAASNNLFTPRVFGETGP